jgi:transglutaminase-like putative cysteine protease
VAKGAELAAGADTDLEVVTAVYDYVTQNISYDYDKAENVKSGYLPVVDETLASGTGICFDYASLMAAMLRSQRIPTRLEIGYVDDMYHSWISVYIDEIGWVEDMIYFDGNKWSLMDPTLASYAKDQVVKDHMDNADQYYEIKYKY